MKNLVSFILASIVCFFLDLFFVGLFSKQYLYFLVCFLFASLEQQYSWYFLLTPLLLLAIESALITGVIGEHFALALIFYYIAYGARELISSKNSALYGSLILFLCISSLLGYFKELSPSCFTLCTSLKITGNVLILYFSLKWLFAVVRGNRF